MSQASDGQGPQPCCAVSGNTLSASEPRFPQLYTEGSNQLGGGFQILRYPEGTGQLPRTPEALPDAGPGAPLLWEGARPDPPAPGGHPVPLQPRPPAGAPGADRPDRAGTEPEGPQPRGPRAEPTGPGEHPLPPGEGKGGPTAGTRPRPSGWAQGTDEAHCIGTPTLSLPALCLGHTRSGPQFPICRVGLGDLWTGLRERGQPPSPSPPCPGKGQMWLQTARCLGGAHWAAPHGRPTEDTAPEGMDR